MVSLLTKSALYFTITLTAHVDASLPFWQIHFNTSGIPCAQCILLRGPYFVVLPGITWPLNAPTSKNQVG